MMTDPSQRAHLGMDGGGALTSNRIAVSICDEDSAFTFVKVPRWMTFWQGGPPVLASKAWDLLPEQLRDTILHPAREYVSPRYLRLAMGGSHSVYILMRINLEHIGRALFQHVTSCRETPELPETVVHDTDTVPELTGEKWQSRQQCRRDNPTEEASGYTVEQWCAAVRQAKQKQDRVFVLMRFFAGERRKGDVEQYVHELAQEHGIEVLMISIDLATDHRWDFTLPRTFHAIMQLAEEGLIDGTLGGPPCSTVARSRHVWIPNGPRPLRFRWCIWGRADLEPCEKARVQEANTLWLNYMAICERISSRGGAHLWEHPADPGGPPYASIWATEEMIQMERRTNACRALLHQCPFGGPVPKLTCLSGTIRGLADLDGIRCPGLSEDHQRGPSIGKNAEGGFHTRRLQTYPPALCREMARLFVETFVHFRDTHTGPTGALANQHDQAAPRVTAWSTWSEQRRCGAVMLNEAAVRQQAVLITERQSAAYVHVDDTVFISDSKMGPLTR